MAMSQLRMIRLMSMLITLATLGNYSVSVSSVSNCSKISHSDQNEKEIRAVRAIRSSAPKSSSRSSNFQDGDIVRISQEEQVLHMFAAEKKCLQRILEAAENSSTVSHDNEFCPHTWDGIVCWPKTATGQTVILPCPNYINNFRISEVASRRCEENGQWFFHSGLNKTWSNYSLCAPITFPEHESAFPDFFIRHMPYIQLIYSTGYSLSLIVLLLAMTVMLYFRKLRCPRNTLHLNLFASFVIRASLALARDLLLAEGIGLAKDIRVLDTGHRSLDSNATHWECRLLMTAFNYAITANYSWIFMEGLYLHTLLFLSVFSESSSVFGYIVFGWLSPLVCVVPWAIVRLTMENDLCWNTHPTVGLFWIIKGPVIVTIILNFCFFLNIIRVLFTKLQSFNSPDSRKYRHRKLVKSALVLIPLFGVPYVLFLGWQHNIDHMLEIFKLYFEMTFNSFNGVIVAMLYCFLNGEVQEEIRKKWASLRLMNSEHCHHSSSTSRRATMTSNIYATRCGSVGYSNSFRSANSTVHVEKDDSEAGQLQIVFSDHSCHGRSSEKVEAVPLKRLVSKEVGFPRATSCDSEGCQSSAAATAVEGDSEIKCKLRSMTPAVVLNL